MQLGNQITLHDVRDPKRGLFRIRNVADFLDCCSTIAARLRDGKRVNVELISDDRARFAETRKAYFAWIAETLGQAKSHGEMVQQMHDQLKATYLLPILCRENQEFADLVYRETANGVTSPIVIKLLSVADSSVTTHAIMQEYFTACQRGAFTASQEFTGEAIGAYPRKG